MNISFKTILNLCFFWHVVGGALYAWQNSGEVSQAAFQQQIKTLSNDQLVESLERLREQTNKLSMELNSESNSSATLMDAKTSPPPPAIGAVDSDQQEGVDEIKRNMQLLQELFAEKNRRQQQQEMDSGNSQNGDNVVPPFPAKMPGSGINVDEIMRSNGVRHSPNGADTNLPPANPMLISSSRVVPKIVDAFELGNSLFLAGDLEQALKSYESVKRTNMSPFERTWLEFLIASCHRGLGDYDQAAAVYRIVEQDLNGVRFVQSAKEWQGFLKKRAEMNEAMAELTIKSDSLLKRAEALTSDPKK